MYANVITKKNGGKKSKKRGEKKTRMLKEPKYQLTPHFKFRRQSSSTKPRLSHDFL